MTIERQFFAVAEAYPNHEAIVSSQQRWLYRDVLAASVACAEHLLAQKATSNFAAVAILATRSASLPIAVLACLRIGLPFAILDAAYPEAHLERMLAMLPSPCLLNLAAHAHPQLHTRVDASTTLDEQTLLDMAAKVTAASIATVARGGLTTEVAYYLFTSGSTGVPKCIETPLPPLAHFLTWYTRVFPSEVGTRYAMLSGLSHDPILRDMFAPLTTGGVLCIPEQAQLRQPRALLQWLQTSTIERLHTTPPMLELLAEGAAQTRLSRLQYVFSGGDMLRASHARRLREFAPNSQLVNFYGTSETPQAVAWYVLTTPAPEPIPIGQGIDDVDIWVLDAQRQPVPQGVQGEVAVCSAYLSKGYRGNAQASQQHYVDQGRADGRTLYLTGDLGYVNAEGQVVLNGRADDQINLNGHRIELGAVQVAIRACPQVANAVVLPIAFEDGDKRLCAFVVGVGPNPSVHEAEIKAQLQAILPSYMVPTLWEWLTHIPLLPNGKVDRQQLIEGLRKQIEVQALATQADDQCYQALEKILRVPVTPDSTFVSLGGDSLSFIRVTMLLEDALGHLPNGWQEMPIGELLAQGLKADAVAQPLSKHLTSVETTLLLRVLSILLVTMSHASAHAIILVATPTLFVLSGISFSKFLRPGIRLNATIKPTLHFIAKFAIPAAIWQALRGVMLHRFWWPDLLLIGTFFKKPDDGHFTFWYLDVLAFNVLMLAMADKLLWRGTHVQAKQGRTDTLRWDCGLLAVGLGAAFLQVSSGFWNGMVGQASVAPFKWFWMLALGLVIAQANTRSRKVGVSLFVFALTLINLRDAMPLSFLFEHQLSTYFLASMYVLIWVDRVPVPTVLRPALVEIGSATLMIYIVNHAVMHLLMPKLGLPDWLWLQMTLAVSVGLMVNRMWHWSTRKLDEIWRRSQTPGGHDPEQAIKTEGF